MRAFTVLLITFLIIFISCKSDSEIIEDASLLIKLEKQSGHGPFPTMLHSFRREDIDSLPDPLKGIPKADTISIQSFNRTDKKRDSLLRSGIIDSATYKDLKRKLYGVSAIDGDKQLMILDLNFNYDFSDDKVHTFDLDFRDKTRKVFKVRKPNSVIDSFPFYTILYKKWIDSQTYDRDVRMYVVPARNFFHYAKTPTEKQKIHRSLHLLVGREEYWLGKFSFEDSLKFKVAISNHWGGYQFVFREEGKRFYSRRNKDSEFEQFEIGDTIQLGKHFIKIDSLAPSLDQLYTQKLDITELPHGYRKGDVMRNYLIEDITGRKRRIKDLIGFNEYLLIDFWGTWCPPCLELTPDLKQIHKDFPKVTMLGVDFDYKKEPGVKYIKDKELDWTHTYIERVRKDSLLHTKLVGKLRIDRYPTFILVNRNMEIISRGTGKDGLEEIKKIIAKSKD